MSEPVRLQKILANAGCGSRRACEEFIVEGRVTVDGAVVRQLGSKADPETQSIEFDNLKIAGPGRKSKGVSDAADKVYYMLNKPKGVLSTNEDPSGRPLAIQLVPEKRRIYCVGRLDLDTEGLLLLTNDGELTNQLTHPRYGVEKIYIAKVDGNISGEQVRKLEKGVHLAEGKTQGCRVRIRKKSDKMSTLELTISEGMNRQVRRMLAAVGMYVRSLKRVAIGPLRLGEMEPGENRRLTPDELRRLQNAIKEAETQSSARSEAAARGETSEEPEVEEEDRDEMPAERPFRKDDRKGRGDGWGAPEKESRKVQARADADDGDDEDDDLIDDSEELDDDDAEILEEAEALEHGEDDKEDEELPDTEPAVTAKETRDRGIAKKDPDLDVDAAELEGLDVDVEGKKPAAKEKASSGSDTHRQQFRDRGEKSPEITQRPARTGRSEPWKKREGSSFAPREGKPWQKREGSGSSDRPYQKREGSSSGPRESKPWQKREGSGGGESKPWQKREGGGSERPYEKRERAASSDRPYQKREGSGSSDRPYQKREGGGSSRPYVKREGGSSDRPYQKREGGGSSRPYVKREGGSSDRPYQKREGSGSSRPFQKREGGPSDRPWQKREGGSSYDRPYQKREGSGSSDRPYQKREGGGSSDRPYQKREGGGSSRPYVKREGSSSDRPYQKREGSSGGGGARESRPYQKREGGGSSDRPYQKREGGGSSRPYVKREGSSSDRPYQKREGGGASRPYQKREGSGSGERTSRPWENKGPRAMSSGGGGGDRGGSRPWEKRAPRGDKGKGSDE